MMWWIKYLKQEEANGEADGGSGGAPSGSDDSAGEPVNWDGLDTEFDRDEGVVEGDLEVAEPTEPAKLVEPAPAAPAVTEATPPAPITPPAAEPAQPVVPTPPTQPTSAPAEPTQAEYRTWRAAKETELASTLYAINEADAAALLTEPETVLPRMAARMHMEVMENAMRALQAILPRAIEGHTQQARLEDKARSLFTGVNPDLADPAYEPYIFQFGEVYRRVNPNASAQDAAKAIGALVRSALGVAQPQGGVNMPTTPVAPAAPAAPVPFTPARGSGSGNPPPVPSNAFAALAEEFLRDED